jgi:hypothetical protein
MEATMRLQFLGKTGESGSGECPAVYLTDRGTYVVQGKTVTDPEALKDVRDLAPDEAVVEVPADIIALAKKPAESPRMVKGREFLELFTGFEHTAFRLEVRDRYNATGEAERFARFLAGDESWRRLDRIERAGWFAMMREATSAGKRVERVRVVTEPHSDYIRFEAAMTPGNQAAGEDIRYLPRTHPSVAGLPSWDYWLFDSRMVARLRFDDDHRMQGAELIEDPAVVAAHCAWRDAAWHHAVPFDTYVKGV